MARIVQKFGGSSVANAERIFRVAKIITDAYAKGNEMCVVLSAQGDTTDDLIAKAEEINPNASKREMDMLLACGEQMSIALMAMAIEKLGYPVVSLCGWQVGMNTSSTHSFARIKKVTCERVKEELDKKRIVLVAGFQGVAEVDAVAHQAGSLQRRQALAHHAVIHRFRLFRRPYAWNQHQHRQHQAEQVQEPLLHIHRSFLLRI